MRLARRLARVLSLAAGAGLMACAPDETVTAFMQSDATYRLMTLDGIPVSADAALQVSEPGALAGEAPCNTFSAEVKAPYPWFELGPIRATRRACPGLAEEARLFETLQDMRFAEVQGSVLILTGEDGAEMVFRAQ